MILTLYNAKNGHPINKWGTPNNTIAEKVKAIVDPVLEDTDLRLAIHEDEYNEKMETIALSNKIVNVIKQYMEEHTAKPHPRPPFRPPFEPGCGTDKPNRPDTEHKPNRPNHCDHKVPNLDKCPFDKDVAICHKCHKPCAEDNDNEGEHYHGSDKCNIKR
ncbi:MAG: hypothetical protein HDQ88_04780 [Clostridia bacterium]|nr:hypothetical protein [Clostridia bacterium]